MDRIYALPKFVNNEKGIYEYLCIFWNTFKNCTNSKIILDCHDLRWIDPNMIASLGLVLLKIKSNKNKVYFNGLRYSVERLLKQYNFIMSENYNFIPRNYIAYKTFSGDSNDEFREYLIQQLKAIKGTATINLLISRLMEIFVNVKMHARFNIKKNRYKNKEIFSSGYYNNASNYVVFTISNNGKTFADNICKNLNINMKNEYDFISWALQKSNTTRTDSPGGLGLFLLRDLVKYYNGYLIILSGKGFYYEDSLNIKKQDFSSPFPGTTITVKIPIVVENIKKNINKNAVYDISDLILEEF